MELHLHAWNTLLLSWWSLHLPVSSSLYVSVFVWSSKQSGFPVCPSLSKAPHVFQFTLVYIMFFLSCYSALEFGLPFGRLPYTFMFNPFFGSLSSFILKKFPCHLILFFIIISVSSKYFYLWDFFFHFTRMSSQLPLESSHFHSWQCFCSVSTFSFRDAIIWRHGKWCYRRQHGIWALKAVSELYSITVSTFFFVAKIPLIWMKVYGYRCNKVKLSL
jgi:hypothetical protein